MAVDVEKRLENVQHLAHLGEDERPVASGLEPGQERGQLLEFTAVILQQPLIWKEQLLPDPLRVQQGRGFGVLFPKGLVANDGIREGRRVGHAGDELRRLGPGLGNDEDKLLQGLFHVARPVIGQLDHAPQHVRSRAGDGFHVLPPIPRAGTFLSEVSVGCQVHTPHQRRKPRSIPRRISRVDASRPRHAADGAHPLHPPLSALLREILQEPRHDGQRPWIGRAPKRAQDGHVGRRSQEDLEVLLRGRLRLEERLARLGEPRRILLPREHIVCLAETQNIQTSLSRERLHLVFGD
mmetsp:Transcript_5126/g.14692  ORF Transcript_5126/g.14692 Transcript_5126/m.14692 type:complete len:295 (-) Transcript_5126:1379-2263(-)